MKRYIALPALALTTLFAGVSTVQAPIATAQEAPAQTMADRYQPYYEPANERTDSYIIMRREGETPTGTKYEPLHPSYYSERTYREGPLSTLVQSSGLLQVMQNSGDLHSYGEDGYTTNVEVLVTYPDGSAEVVTATATLISSMARLSTASYSDAWIEPGSTETFSPENDGHSPTLFSVVQSAELDTFREQGWDFSIDSLTGSISVTAPEEEGQELNLGVNVVYEDGSNEIVSASFRSGVEPTQEPDQDQDREQGQDPEPEPKPSGSSSLSSSSPFSFLGNFF